MVFLVHVSGGVVQTVMSFLLRKVSHFCQLDHSGHFLEFTVAQEVTVFRIVLT